MKITTMLRHAVLAVALTAAGPVLAKTTLQISLQLPITHHLGQNLEDFKREVEAQSNGDIEVRIFPSAQLFKDSEVHQAVTSGAINMGVLNLTQLAGTIPAVDVFYVPFMFPTPEKVAAATAPDSPVRELLDAEILKTGARPLWWQAYGGVALLSKEVPIKRPEDMAGMKVRVFGKTLGEFVRAVGGAPVSIPGSEQFLAYQRGVVDAGMTGVSAVGPRKLYQVMNNLTVTNHADIEFMTIINEKFWQSLPDEHKAIITAAARKVEKQLREKMQGLEQQAIVDASEKMNVIHLDDDDVAAWREATQPVLKKFLENSGELGQKVVEAAQSL